MKAGPMKTSTGRQAGKARSKGIAAVETAVVLPLLITFLVGVWEVGRMVQVKQLVQNAAREAGRQASSGKKDVAGVQSAALNYLQRAGIDTTGAVVNVSNVTGGSTDPTQADQLDHYEITVQVPYQNVRWIDLPSITGATSITASSQWYSMRDLPVVVSDAIPPE